MKCWQKKMNISIKHMINWKKSVQTKEKRLEYEERQKAIRDHRHMLASGRREGLREGLREGKHEHAVEMARKMLEDKLPIEKIAEYSGLSPEDVHRLEEQ